MDRVRYIAIEGPIGVGKTTLAHRLAERLSGRVLLEPSDDNPFLQRFYAEPRKHALQTQLFFLLSRWQQQQALWQQHLFTPLTISDYLFEKDRLFAALTLEPDEQVLYDRVRDMMGERVVKPDLVIYLQARSDVLLSRVRRRGRAWERDIDPDYLELVAKAWADYFFRYEETPLLVVNANDVDLEGSDAEVDALISVIRRHRAGTSHYVPLGTTRV